MSEQQFMEEVENERLWKSLEIYQVVRASKCLSTKQLEDLRVFLGFSTEDTGEKR